jgi:hypothetical protein
MAIAFLLHDESANNIPGARFLRLAFACQAITLSVPNEKHF